MRKIKIVADSACDLFQLEKVDFASAALKVITDEREFIDNERLDVSGMVAYLDKYKGKSKSSCPNPTDWITAFGDADRVLLVDIYAAREVDTLGVSSALLAERIGTKASYAGSVENAAEMLRSELREGDAVVVMGAGNVDRIFKVLEKDIK